MDIHWRGPVKLLGRVVCHLRGEHQDNRPPSFIFRTDEAGFDPYKFRCDRCGLTQHVHIVHFDPYYGDTAWDG